MYDKASKILADLRFQVRTQAPIAASAEAGFQLKDGRVVEGCGLSGQVA
jgi:hypothetical protein